MRRGVTLIEMMVVLVIAGMMLAMTVPLFKVSPSQSVRAAGKQLARDLELARTRALSSKSAVKIVLNVAGNSYTAYQDDNRDGVFLETTAEMRAMGAGFPVTLDRNVTFGRGTAPPAPGDSVTTGADTFINAQHGHHRLAGTRTSIAARDAGLAATGRIVQLLDDLIAEEELEELGFGDVGGQFDVIEAALTKLIDHIWLVVLEDDEIHQSAP